MVESFLESNKKKKAKEVAQDPETKKLALEAKDKYECFKKLVDSESWKECEEFLKDEIYNALNYAPGDGGDWWLKYGWGLKACVERIKSHAKKYEEAIEFLSKQ